jgi:3-phosphoshikimate 1-carboxyvinyltransferase
MASGRDVDRLALGKTTTMRGDITVPPDKSISHRAVMFAALAEGKSRVKNFLRAEDPLSTVSVLQHLGVSIEESEDASLIIHGRGLHGLTEATDVLDCRNSGTTMRLMAGILSGNDFFSVLTGDDSLRRRPMARVIKPLGDMGARISARSGDRFPPLAIRGGGLRALQYAMPVASAQVKSCLLLAGLYADGVTSLTEPFISRDHTERMLRAMGARLTTEGLTVKVEGGGRLEPVDITVPGDFSSAAFFIAAALMVQGSDVLIRGVGVNPTRCGFLDVVETMGAQVALKDPREISGEPVADLHCRSVPRLAAAKVGAEMIPAIIDEFPILCVLATQAEGVTEIRGAEELRVKESDRISTMVSELRAMGVDIEEYPDGVAIRGGAHLRGASVKSHGDHRIAMALSVASLAAAGTTMLDGVSSVDVSFPGFYETLGILTAHDRS